MRTRFLLVVSLAVNALLGAIVVFRVPRNQPNAPAQEAVPNNPGPLFDTRQTRPFNWSQVESSDYPTYIANLRGIGCPEQTVRDIITADVDGLYAPKRRNLDDQSRACAGDAADVQQQRTRLRVERDRLWHEEANLLARLLGYNDRPVASTSSTISGEPGRPQEPKLPLVFANFDASSLNLSPQQAAVIEGMRRSFLAGLNSDPSSQAYGEYWQQAQPRTDHSLQLMLGYEVYQKLQLRARNSLPINSSAE